MSFIKRKIKVESFSFSIRLGYRHVIISPLLLRMEIIFYVMLGDL